MKTHGIHHISSITSDVKKSHIFYTKVLGLILVKNTVNHSKPYNYHLYYSNRELNSPLCTIFPMPNNRQGKLGDGQCAASIYTVTQSHYEHIIKLVNKKKYKTIFQDEFTFIQDPDNLWIALKISSKQKESIILKGFILYSKSYPDTLNFFKSLSYSVINKNSNWIKIKKLSNDEFILISKNNHGLRRPGIGTTHHIALSVPESRIQNKHREYQHYHPTNIIDRYYFQSFYFTEVGGILIEIATDVIDLYIDEIKPGSKLIIPKHFKKLEVKIKEKLTDI